MDEDELNAKLMLTLMKKMTPKVYVGLRKVLVEQGLEDALAINALISEMDYVSDFNNGATLVIDATNPDDVAAFVEEGALVSRILREGGADESTTGLSE